jgi:hypothetical protein
MIDFDELDVTVKAELLRIALLVSKQVSLVRTREDFKYSQHLIRTYRLYTDTPESSYAVKIQLAEKLTYLMNHG